MSLTVLKSFPLDFAKAPPLGYIYAKQGDQNSRILEITPLDNGAAYEIPPGTTARFGAKKPDGTQILDDAVISDGKIYVTLCAQALAVSGAVTAEIALYGLCDDLLSSQHFHIMVERSAIDPDAVESSDEYRSFETALLELEESISEAENVNISALQTATGADITVTDRDGVSTTVHIDTLFAVNSIKDVEQAVKLGLGPTLFPVGYEFEIPKETSLSAGIGQDNTGVTSAVVDEETFLHAVGEAHGGCYEAAYDGAVWQKENGESIILSDYGITVTGTPAAGDKILITETAQNVKFVVRAHDHHAAADTRLAHTMTLETKYVYGTSAAYKPVVFDAREALYFAENGLPAGNYCFTVKNQNWYSADNDKVYYFTLSNDVLPGGQLVLDMVYNVSLQGKTVNVYASASATSPSETASLSSTPVAGAISLGTADGNTGNMNYMPRAIFGSGNYAQSNVRQWLNSTDKVNTYYEPQTKFDRPNAYITGADAAYAGFAHGFGDDFLSAVKAAAVPCRTNGNYEIASLDGTVFTKNSVYGVNDKFFLLSRPEIYGTWDNSSLKDGEILEYYDGLTDSERAKYDSFGTAHHCWIRSPYPWSGTVEYCCNATGAFYSSNADNGNGVTVACIIA